ncbi:MAG: O-antigen ligase family protein [Bacteroidetes bacterium]|nr:O-antigen ligase family protein [Bacteroidota bacterium]
MKKSPYQAEIFAAINIGIAMVLLINPRLSTVYSILILIYGTYRIFKNKNADGAAHIIAAYVVGIEVLFRMNSGGFGYEYGKYATILFLTMGILVGSKKRKLPISFIIFILLMLPSIFYVDYPTFDLSRQMVSFNISGPITLGISAIYFYRRRLPITQLRRTFLAMLYPIIAMSIFVYFRSGSLEDVDFTTESNFQASGGFGPNQVSTVFGLGILIIAACYFMNIRLFRIKNLNIILLLAFLIRGLATFSRGGMLAPIVAIIICVVVMSLTDAAFQDKLNRVVYIFMALFVVSVIGFYYVNDVSGGLLEMRFKGESMYNKDKSNLFSGRMEIFDEDIEIFKENVLTGVGPGMASEKRGEISGIFSAAHIEYSRLLAEHGIFGIIAILIMVLFPVSTFFKMKSSDEKVLLILCCVFVFITLGHAAMRIAAPGFIYGLGFISIIRKMK